MRRLFALVVLLLVTLHVAPAGAQTQVPCDAILVDEAGVLGDGALRVHEAAESLAAEGATVRVVVLSRSGGSLDAYVDALQRRCDSWQEPGGGTRDDLIVVAVSIEEQMTGFYSGPRWADWIDGHMWRIQDDLMHPRFAADDMAGGLVAGLEELRASLGRQAPPPPAAPSPRGPEGRSGFNAMLVGGVVLGVVVAGWIGGSGIVRRRRGLRDAREAVTGARDAAAAAYVALEERWSSARESAEVMVPALGPHDVQALDNLRHPAAASFDAGTRAHVGAADAFRESARLTLAQSAEARASFEEASGAIAAASGPVEAFAAHVAFLEHALVDLPKAIPAATKAIDDARHHEARLQAEGYRTDRATSRLADAEAVVQQAGQLHASKEVGAARQQLDAASDLIERASAWLAELPATRAELGRELAELRDLLDGIAAGLAPARQVFESLATEFADSSWEAVAGNGTEATKRLEACVDLLDEAAEQLDMRRQEWDGARRSLLEVREWLDEARTMLGAIHALRESLEQARREAPGEIDAARTDIEAARRFLDTHREDVSAHLEADIAHAADVLERAVAGLGETRPDYLQVVADAREANEAADRVMDQARGEQETMQRLRAQAQSARRDAQAALSRADRFIASHRRDVSSDARAMLARAYREWEDVDAATDLESQIAEAREAQAYADDAYNRARRDFRGAEQRRASTTRNLVIGAAVGSAMTRRSGGFGSWGSTGGSRGASGAGRGLSGGSRSWSGGGGLRGGSSRW